MIRNKRKTHFLPESFRTFLWSRSFEAVGILFICLSLFISLSLFSYDPSDSSLNVVTSLDKINNFFGQKGAFFSDFMMQYLGKASYVFAYCIFIWGVLYFQGRALTAALKRSISLIFSVFFMNFSFSTMGIYLKTPLDGVVGITIFTPLYKTLSSFNFQATFILISVFSTFISLLLFAYATSLTLENWRNIGSYIWKWVLFVSRKTLWLIRKWHTFSSLKPKEAATTTHSNDLSYTRTPYDDMLDNKKGHVAPKDTSLMLRSEIFDEGEIVAAAQHPEHSTVKQGTSRKTLSNPEILSLSDDAIYTLPDLSLLQDPSMVKQTKLSRQEIEKNINALSQVLEDYGVKGQIIGAKPGPVVTLYELEPAPGIKSSRIIGLADDIARSMHAISARIAVVPAQNLIGIELPNDTRQTVYLQDILGSKDFDDSNAKLNMALGKNISGVPILTDLARMPHMIVAGTTGSGKSVGINAMIISLLYRHSPETCRLILIDPKMLEFSMYNDIPHLLTPVVTEPNKAIFALKWAVREMENRYRGMSHLGVRNIENYNAALKQAKKEGREITRTVQTGFDAETGHPIFEEQPINMKPLPYIVIVVDEMADLMMVAGKDIEAAVQRLAQMARAAGIHVIMATQRPSVDVITGTIKANFPTRISFQVTSKFDSRTILGEQGAEQLLGRGDMLFMEAGGRIQRIHGPFVSDEEVERIVSFLKTQGKPDYVSNVCDESSDFGMETGGGSNNDEADDLYQKAVTIVRTDRKASTSYVQRRLQIGYNRAARIIEQMEAAGVISSANHVGKREVLLDE